MPLIIGAPLKVASRSNTVSFAQKAPRKVSKSAVRKGKPLLFVKPTAPVMDKMIREFGHVVVPRSEKVVQAYAKFLKLPVGNFNPLKYAKPKQVELGGIYKILGAPKKPPFAGGGKPTKKDKQAKRSKRRKNKVIL